jgi:hypothetical protein
MRSFRTEKVSPRRAAFLALAGDVESQLRDAYDERHRAHGVTQASIAKVLGVNRSAINHRLRGLTNMTIETLADMIWALGYAIKIVIYDPRKTSENHALGDLDVPAAAKQVSALPATSSNSYAVRLAPNKFAVTATTVTA